MSDDTLTYEEAKVELEARGVDVPAFLERVYARTRETIRTLGPRDRDHLRERWSHDGVIVGILNDIEAEERKTRDERRETNHER